MAKVLYIAAPAYGHLNPSLPVVKELVARGEEVTYYSTEKFRTKITKAGATYMPYKYFFKDGFDATPDSPVGFTLTMLENIKPSFDLFLEEVKAQKPDYIVYDAIIPLGKYTAEALKIPCISYSASFAGSALVWIANPQFLMFALKMMLTNIVKYFKLLRLFLYFYKKYRIVNHPLNDIIFHYTKRNIVHTSRLFQPLQSIFKLPQFEFIGPTVEDRFDEVDFPMEKVVGKEVVYITLGTVFNNDPEFYKICIEAFRNRSEMVVIPVGSSIDPAELHDIPQNVTVVKFAPQLEVLKNAKLMITVGGAGSVGDAIFYKVPMIVIPSMIEQELNALQVERHKVGIYLKRNRLSKQKLRECVDDIYRNIDTYRSNLGIVAKSFIDAGGASRATEVIMNFRTHLSK